MSQDNLEKLKSAMAEACHRLWARRLVANHDGNITYRLGDGRFLATPTSFSKKDVSENDLLVIDDSGTVVNGSHKIFSEVHIHLAIYRARPDIRCVVHGHPPIASAFGLARREIGTPVMPEAIVSLGRSILNSAFYSPSDPLIKKPGSGFELEMKRVFAQSDAFVMPGNGAWSVGSEIFQTYLRLELLEHMAEQHLAAEQLGQVHPLATALVDELVAKRAKPSSVREPAPKSFTTSSPEAGSVTREQVKNVVIAELGEILKNF